MASTVLPTPQSLDEFLQELADQHGIHRKIRLLGRYWRQIKDLPTDDRQRVALALGSQSAWRHLEKLFGADGHLSEGELVVKRALNRVGSAEPSELRILANRMRSGDYAEVGSDLLEAMGQALDDEADAGTEGDEEAEERPSEREVPPDLPEDRLERHPAADERVAEPEPMAEARIPVQPLVEPKPIVAPVRTADPAPAVATAPPGRDRARNLKPEIQPPHTGPEWKTRRLLGARLRSSVSVRLDEALATVASFNSPTQRFWCLADLIEHKNLDADDLTRILALAPSRAAQRRLRGRYARKRGA